MCGICGKLDARERVAETLLEDMCTRMAHRGPDDQGVMAEGGIGLGNRRLAILDLTSAGHQPMESKDGRFVVTYNGEVYNFKELRAELRGLGHPFRSGTDTEVVLTAFQEWGTACLRRFNGIFGIAIWDRRDLTLLIARDQMGVKPVYWYSNGHTLVFGSEIKSILADPSVPVNIDPQGLLHYLTFGHGIAPTTMFEGINKLLPGHYMLCRKSGTGTVDVKIERYWSLPQPTDDNDLGEDEYAEEIRRRLKQAVERQMVADVPVGVFLSGGVDSSAITGLMASAMADQLNTFTVGFDDAASEYDELRDARRVADHFGTEHHEVMVSSQDIVESLPRMVHHYDEPFADAASLPTFLLSRMARSSVPVVLSGEGSDEVFGGYRRYVAEKATSRWSWLSPVLGHRITRSLLRASIGSGKTKRLIRGWAISDPISRYGSWLEVFSDDHRQALLDADWAQAIQGRDALQQYRAIASGAPRGAVDRAMHLDQAIWLPDTYLEKVDKATMASGLEARVPFLDLDLVEYAARIPSKYKVKGASTKYILKRAVEPLLPPGVINKKKHGFSVPYPLWFRGKLRSYVTDILLGSNRATNGILDRAGIESLLRKYLDGKETNYRQLWLLVVFELWCQQYLGDRSRLAEAIA